MNSHTNALNFDLNKDAIANANSYSSRIYEVIKNTTLPTKGYVVAAPEFVGYWLNDEEVTNLTYDLDESLQTIRVIANIPQNKLDEGEKMGIEGLKYEWWYKDRDNYREEKVGECVDFKKLVEVWPGWAQEGYFPEEVKRTNAVCALNLLVN